MEKVMDTASFIPETVVSQRSDEFLEGNV